MIMYGVQNTIEPCNKYYTFKQNLKKNFMLVNAIYILSCLLYVYDAFYSP